MTPTLFHNLCNFRSQRRWWLIEEKKAQFYNYFLEFAATHPKKNKKLRWDSQARKLIIEKRKKNIGSYHTKTISLADQIKIMEKVDGFQNKMKKKNQVVAVINNGIDDAPTIN